MDQRDGREVTIEVDRLVIGRRRLQRAARSPGAECASDGRATFVPPAASREGVAVRIEREKGRVARASRRDRDPKLQPGVVGAPRKYC